MSLSSSGNTTQKFLDAILPGIGLRCIVILERGAHYPRQEFYNDNQSAASAILAHDRRGATVYHACATYATRGSRKARNVQAVQSLWLDLDAGSEKPYPDVEAAEIALLDFCTWHDFPDPLMVRSGRGIHCYWLLADPLDRVTWKRYAEGLKKLCYEYGLEVDPSRTADIASILRPVGSHHRKNPDDVRLVALASSDFSRHAVSDFALLLRHENASAPLLGARPAHLAGITRETSLTTSAKVYQNEPSDPEGIAELCAQMRSMRDTLGALPEPRWRACLGVLASCGVSGNSVAHAWSKGDPRYDPAETQGKLDRCRETGPTTCAHFAGLDPGGCHECAYRDRVTSPIQLGRSPYTARNSSERDFKQQPVQSVLHGLTVPAQPAGFRCTPDGLFYESEKNGLPVNVTICPNPLYLLAISTGEKTENNHVFVFNHYHPVSGWHDFTVAIVDILGRTGGAALGASGVIIHDNDSFKHYLKQASALLQKAERTQLLYEQFGWKEDGAFFIGKKLYKRGGSVPAPAGGEAKNREKYFAIKGTLDDWTSAADRLFAPGGESQGFAVMCAFAAPLMKFSSDDEGGAVVSFVSRETAKGKSTAFAGAASVWGEIGGLEIKNTATENAKGITFGALGNLPVVFDEATQRDPDELRRFLEIFTSGRDRMRAQTDGTMRHRSNFWQTILLCGANSSMVETIRAGSGSDAMAYRVFEVQANLPKNVEHVAGEKLKQTLKANQGTAGDRYLRYLTEIEGAYETAKQRVQDARDEIYGLKQFTRDHRFWVRLLAGVKVASEIVNHLGILHFNVDTLMTWAYARASDMGEGAVIDPLLGHGPAALAEYVNENAFKIVTVAKPPRPGIPCEPLFRPHGMIVGRYETDTGRLILASKPWRKWLVEHDYSPREVLHLLTEAGILSHTNKLCTLTAGTNISGGQVSSVVLNGKHPKFRYQPPTEDDAQKQRVVVPLKGGLR